MPKPQLPNRRRPRTPRRTRPLGLALALVAGGTGLLASPAQAADALAVTTLHSVASTGVQVAPRNLTSPEAGVSRVQLVRGQMDGFKTRSRLPARDVAVMTYQVRIPREVHDTGLAKVDLKLPGLAGAPEQKGLWYASSGGKLHGDSFSVRLHSRSTRSARAAQPGLDAYVYAPRVAGKSPSRWGVSVPLTEGLNGSGARLGMPVDRWFEVGIRVRVNTPGQQDGELDVWVDGRQGVSLRNVQWRDRGVSTPVNVLMAETFYNQPGAPRNGHIDLRDFAVRDR